MLYPQRYSELNPTPPAGMASGLKPSVSVRQSLADKRALGLQEGHRALHGRSDAGLACA
jgi:hypothetical protein